MRERREQISMARISTLRIHDARKNYIKYVKTLSKCDNYYDSSLSSFYGKINFNGDVVYVSEKYLSVLPSPNNKTHYALNFVVDAFTDFRQYYIKGINTGFVKDENMKQLIKPARGWISFHQLYASNIETTYAILINNYLQRKERATTAFPNNFDKFVSSLKDFFQKAGSSVTISRSSFILSTACPLLATGLSIELAPGIDKKALSLGNPNIQTSRNYKFYLNALKKHGFMVDVDNPTRILADIGSPAMQKYMSKYDLNIDNLFSTYYYKASEYDFDLIKFYMTQFYNNYATDYPVRVEAEKVGSVQPNKYTVEVQPALGFRPMPTSTSKFSCPRTIKQIIRKNKLTQKQMESKYNDSYWISFYIEMLNYELGMPLDGNQIKKIIKNAQDINKHVDIESSKGYINRIFKILRYPVSETASSDFSRADGVRSFTQSTVSTSQTSDTSTSTSGGGYSGGSSGGSSGGGY